jgi:hypothetical protein
MSAIDWPDAGLSTVARLRILAATLPGAGHAETTIDVPFAEAWPRLMELERSVPAADRGVRAIRVLDRSISDDGAELLDIRAWTTFGLPQRFDVRVEEGFCLMRGRGRLFVVVMAAEPVADDPTRTRYAHVEAVPRRGGGLLRRVMQPTVESDVRGFHRYLQEGR